MGHLADLRGDRGSRHGGAASTPRTTATSSRSTRPSQVANIGKSPVPLKFLGRYAHEAVAVDPRRHGDLPDRGRGRPARAVLPLDPAGGLPRRQGCAAAARPQRGGDTAGHPAGDELLSQGGKHIAGPVPGHRPRAPRTRSTWVDVPDRDARDRLGAQAVHRRPGHPQPQARGPVVGATAAPTSSPASPARADGSVNEHDGQVWFYDPATETVTLKTIFGVNPDPTSTPNYDGPDNITVSPYGGLILAEDGEGLSTWSASPSRARPTRWPATSSTTASSPARRSARTASPVRQHPDPGIVFAITGPWRRQGAPS